MASKKVKAALAAKNIGTNNREGFFSFTYETKGTVDNFLGKIKDEKGRIIFEIIENEDFNTLSLLTGKGKYMSNPYDTKGLAQYLWDRNIIPMDDEVRDGWKKKKVIPIDIVVKKM